MKVGITGHQRLDDETAWPWVESSIESCLAAMDRPLVGISSLAIGVDQLFASILLRKGGSLHVVLPFKGYETTFDSGVSQLDYFNLLRMAGTIETLEGSDDLQQSFFAAGKRVVDIAEEVIAVWDGEPASGLGGTGDVVRYAESKGKRVVHLNPITREVGVIYWHQR